MNILKCIDYASELNWIIKLYKCMRLFMQWCRDSSTTWRSFHLKDRAQKMKNYILTGEPHGLDFDVKNDGKIT